MRTHKTTILALTLILLAAIALCSCNLDATDGIYSEIADSTESTNVTIKSFLGIYNDEYYYLSDEAVRKIGSGNAVFGSSEQIIVRGASLNTTDGSFLVLNQNRNTLTANISYYAGATANAEPLDGTFNGLLPNGLFYDSSKIYRYNAGASAILSDVAVQYYLVCGDYAFFSVKDADQNYKFYVIQASTGTKLIDGIDGSSTTYIGFQRIADDDYVLLNYNNSNATSNLYKLTSAGVSADVWTKLQSSVPSAYSTQSASFLYNDGAADYIIFKCNSYFDKVKVSDGTVQQISTGFAANLRTADITNILESGTAGVYIAGTVDSMLYRMDLANDTSTQLR
ncbi:MAG: hypothetical protein IJS84_09060 [Spirochaetales bacterium]|nr:hypothetical protein [Spirochaetales bacterium]